MVARRQLRAENVVAMRVIKAAVAFDSGRVDACAVEREDKRLGRRRLARPFQGRRPLTTAPVARRRAQGVPAFGHLARVPVAREQPGG